MCVTQPPSHSMYHTLCHMTTAVCAIIALHNGRRDVRQTSVRRTCTEIRSHHIPFCTATQSGYGGRTLTVDHNCEIEQEPQLTCKFPNQGRRLWQFTTSCACRYTNCGITCGKLPEGCFYWNTNISCFLPCCVCVCTIFWYPNMEWQVVVHLHVRIVWKLFWNKRTSLSDHGTG